MPANKQAHGATAAVRRLLQMVTRWRQRRAARRRARLHDFMHMSDRMLADIGVRRADVQAAMSGMVPVERIARTRSGPPWTVHALRPRSPQPSEAFTTSDLSAAA